MDTPHHKSIAHPHPLFHLTPSRLLSQDEESPMIAKATINPPGIKIDEKVVYKCIYCIHETINNKGALASHLGQT